MIPQLPNPCPTLKEGLALGADEHKGFVKTFNWIVDFFKKIKDRIPTSINDRTGKIAIVAGSGIDVVANGNTITIRLGDGTNEDKSNPSGVDPNGGGAVDDPGKWTDEKPTEREPPMTFASGSGMFEWDSATKTMGVGGVMVGRNWVEAEIGDEASGDGNYMVEVDHGTYPYKAKVIKGTGISQAATDSKCYIPIYTVVGGVVTVDRRGAFVVPIWEG